MLTDMDFFANKMFLIALTFAVFVLARQLQAKTGVRLLNPILVSITVLIVILLLARVDYSTYRAGGDYIDFWLKPAVVALECRFISSWPPSGNRCCRCSLPKWPAVWPALFR